MRRGMSGSDSLAGQLDLNVKPTEIQESPEVIEDNRSDDLSPMQPDNGLNEEVPPNENELNELSGFQPSSSIHEDMLQVDSIE